MAAPEGVSDGTSSSGELPAKARKGDRGQSPRGARDKEISEASEDRTRSSQASPLQNEAEGEAPKPSMAPELEKPVARCTLVSRMTSWMRG